MIQRSIATWQDLSWQDELRELITDPEQLIAMLELDESLLPEAKRAATLFPLRVTPSFVSRMRRSDINDPLLRQVLPLGAECLAHPDYTADPLQELQANPLKGLIHKYHGRVLLMSTTSCAINCRYCFRREFNYAANRLSKPDWENIFSYIKQDKHISEVIFSGGDPLLQPDKHFQWLIGELEKIPHLERIRLHSRLPIVLPNRITPDLLDAFNRSRFRNVWVIHCNHANEIDKSVAETLKRIANADITLLNQAVLLRGVNDSAKTQHELSMALFSHRTLPYYLHVLDKVSGTAHFDLDENQVQQIYQEMTRTLPGYLLPVLAREEPGMPAKTRIAS